MLVIKVDVIDTETLEAFLTGGFYVGGLAVNLNFEPSFRF